MGELVCMQGCLFFTFILMGGGGEKYSDQGRILGSFRAILGKIMTVSSLIMTLNGYIQIQRTYNHPSIV